MNSHHLLLCFLFSNALQAAPPPELTLLRQQYEKIYAERVTTVHEASVSALNTKFTAALDNAITTAQQAGKLDDILAIQDDKKRLGEKLPIPDDDEKTPESLKKLRAIYREQLKKLEDARAASIATLLPAYQGKLQDLETTLTKAGRIDEAKELRTYREGLAQSGPLSPLSGAAPSTTTPPTTPAAAATPTNARKAKGDDRKAAEWLLKVGGHFSIEAGGKISSPAKPEDLPKGKFSITSLGLDGRDTKETLTADGLATLQGLNAVTLMQIGQLNELTDADVSFLATLPNLEKVGINRCPKIGDGVVDHVAGLKYLQSFSVGETKLFTGGTLHKLAGLRSLSSVGFVATGVGNEGVAALSAIKSLTGIGLESCGKVTDEAIPHLSQLAKLTNLGITGTNITPAGFAQLKPRLEFLDCGRLSNLSPRSYAPVVGPAFPEVFRIRLPQSEAYTIDDFKALAHFTGLRHIIVLAVKDAAAWAGLAELSGVTNLTLDRNPFSDAELDHVLRMPSLKRIELMFVDVTDAGLMKLAAMKSLKEIVFNPADKITPAGIAAFKKARPDVKMNK